ncbi:MAG: HYR domain-containing protein [Saprospiraceae bacterium]|nr:HYR domain-containing protein [Saprospiraceae bacterium]
MNRALLLLLSVLTINLFGKVISPEYLKQEIPKPSTVPLISKLSEPAEKRQVPDFRILADTIDPEIFCPASDTILLAPGSCDTVLNYTVTATDDQGTAIVIQLSGPASGSVFPSGISTCVFLATDLAGNTATCAFSFTVESSAPPTLTCNDLVYVELDSSCAGTLAFYEVLESAYGCASDYVVEVDKTVPFGNGPWLPATFNATDIGKTYQDRVTNVENGNKCWGNVKILDKIGPVFTCPGLIVSCAEENLSPNFLKDSLGLSAAVPQVSDACGPHSTPTFIDNGTNYSCDTPYTRIVSRSWLSIDDSGNTGTCIQYIKQHRHTLAEMQLPPDLTLHCPDTNTTPDFTGTPFVLLNGKKYGLNDNSICEISAFYEDFPLALPCGDVRIRRLWEYFDFCTGVSEGPFLQNIYVLDETGPIVDCPASLFVTVDADTCYGMVDLPDVVLSDACSQLSSFQAFWEDNGLSKTLIGSLGDLMGNDSTEFDTLGAMGSILLSVGTTTITYVAEDSCGNIGDCIFNLTVADLDKPVARCDTFSTVQLFEDGLMAVGAGQFDNGSTDGCTSISFKTRFLALTPCLYDTLWTDTLRFCCLNQNDTLDAVLRVYDIPVPSGDVSGNYGVGHFSDCTMKIIVTDPNPPLCMAPQNQVVDCENFDPSLESYGFITSTSCAVDSVALEVDYTQFDTICNRGTIVRIFHVFDQTGNSGACAQAVQVDYSQDYFTKFPDDVIVTVCDTTGIYGEPVLYGQACEEFEVVFTDEVFTVLPDACYKIERTWQITNRCKYDSLAALITVPNPNPNSTTNHPTNLPGPIVSACGTAGLWAPSIVKINPTDPSATNYCTFFDQNANGYKYKQIIKVIDGQAPNGTYVVPNCTNQDWATPNNPQFWNEMYWFDPVLGIHDLCEEPTDLSITATDACYGSSINIEYVLYLDLDGDGNRESVISSTQFANIGWNNVLYNNLNTPNFSGGTPRAFDGRPIPSNQKMGFAIEETISGKHKTARVRWNTQQQPNVYFAPELPHGTHRIKWFITDGCGNNKEYEYTFTVRDCKPPVVECHSNLAVNIMPTMMITLWASDFLQFTDDNCTPQGMLKIGIRKCGTGTGFPIDANGNPITSVTFDCFELGTQCVELWSIDLAGNADYCETNVEVQNNLGVCPGPNGPHIDGSIKTELGKGIEAVSIAIEGTVNFAPPFSYFFDNETDSTGQYFILNAVPFASTFSIKPELDDNPLNGVTTYDLVLISKHILATEPLNSPYKMIAADANKSGSITTFDIVEIRKLILGTYTSLPQNTSWRFVDYSFVFPNPLNPFQTGFPDTIPIFDILINISGLNFVGIKVGDVNHTVVPNLISPAEERFEGTVYFNAEDREVRVGEIFELKISTLEQLEGCQFTLETDGLEILEIIAGENMGQDNFALFSERSLLTMAWETGGRADFSLKLKAQKTGSVREMLRISDQITQAEAYVSSGALPTNHQSYQSPITRSRIALRFGNSNAAFELYQNQPNPFSEKTAITFQLPEASAGVLTILDGNGRVLWSRSSDWPAGMNTVEIDLTGLSAAGVLYYKLETDHKSAVRKMVRI